MIIDNIPEGYLATSQIHGIGLFATTLIIKNAIIGILDGQLVHQEAVNRVKIALPCYKTDIQDKCQLLVEWNAMPDSMLLVRPYRTKYSFMNHSRQPNCEVNNGQIIALHDIYNSEELTLDYRKEPLSDEYLTGHGATYL